MALYLGVLIFSFIITSLLFIPFINILYRLKLTRRSEIPKGKKIMGVSVFDKMHDYKAGTPVGGGILIVFLVSVLFLLIFKPISYLGVFIHSAYDVRAEMNIVFITFVGFALLGLYDDLVKIFGKMYKGKIGLKTGLKNETQFVLQWVIALLVSYLMYKQLNITIVHVPLLDIVINIGYWFIPFGAFVIVSFANAVNITDGLDGLVGGILLICLFAFWIISAQVLDTPLSIFISLWIGALIAFLYFNVWPARIFLGDAGAVSFGATLAVVGLLTGKIFVLLVIGGLFIIEVASSMVQIFGWRFLSRPIFPIAPLHLWFQLRGWEEPKIVMRSYLAGLMLAIFGLWLAFI